MHPGSAHFNASIAEMYLGQWIFFPIPVCAMCCCGLISLQFVAVTEITTNNHDTMLLAKIFCNSFHQLCDLEQSIAVFHC